MAETPETHRGRRREGPGSPALITDRRRRMGTLAAGIVALGATGWVDYITGGDLGLAPVYLLIVSVMTWYAGFGVGVLTASLAGLAWIAAVVPFRAPSQVWLIAANGSSRLMLFLVAAYLANRLRVTQDRLADLNRQLAVALQRESSLARTDPLTGLLNRRGFVEQAEREIARSGRTREPLAIAYVDLDNFKALNDEAGHEQGDRCLQAVASALVDSIRKTDVAARLGGDEFAVLMPSSSGSAAEVVCRRLGAAIQSVAAGFASPGLDASIGLVNFPHPPASAQQLLKQADEAMYSAKRDGKGRVHVVGEH